MAPITPISRAEFEAYFTVLETTVLEHAKKDGLPENVLEWIQRSLKYNVTGGKYNRGMSVVDSVRILKQRELTEQEKEDAAVLGWMIELLQAFFLVSDDIMDDSKTRRGQPCWYLNKEVGLIAINDAFVLEMCIYKTMRARFRKHAEYVDMVELLQDITWKTEMGQMCDLLTAPEDNVNLDNFSFDKFNFIVRHKTSYYSFYLSVALALHYCELATEDNLRQSLEILLPMGDYFQAQDDYLDAFGSPEVIGKIGTDIQDNKCSWVINTALAAASPAQRAILDENYGRKDGTKEAAVRVVFNELNITETYEKFEQDKVGQLQSAIANLDESAGLQKEVFDSFLAKIYKRSR